MLLAWREFSAAKKEKENQEGDALGLFFSYTPAGSLHLFLFVRSVYTFTTEKKNIRTDGKREKTEEKLQHILRIRVAKQHETNGRVHIVPSSLYI